MNKRKLTNKEKGILADAFCELDEKDAPEMPSEALKKKKVTLCAPNHTVKNVKLTMPKIFYQSVNGCVKNGEITSTIEIGVDFTNVGWYPALEKHVAELVTGAVENQIANNYSDEDMKYLFENNALTIKLVDENYTRLSSFKPGTCGLNAIRTHFNFFARQAMGSPENYAELRSQDLKVARKVERPVPIPHLEVDSWLKSLDKTYAVMKDNLDTLYDCQRRLTNIFFN